MTNLLWQKTLWWFILVWLWHKHLSLSYWGIFPQYEDQSHPAAADAMKDNYWVMCMWVSHHKLWQASTLYKGLFDMYSRQQNRSNVFVFCKDAFIFHGIKFEKV